MADEKRISPGLIKTGVAVYLFLCLVLFASMRFPYDTFRGRLEGAISSMVGQPVALGHIRSSFPFGFTVEGMSINKSPFARELKLDPSLIALLAGRLNLDVEALFSSGRIEGSIHTPFGDKGGALSISARMDNLDSQAFRPLFSPGIDPRGFVSGTIELSGPGSSIRELGGKANIVWKEGYVPLPVSLLPIDGLQFKVLQIDSVMEKGLLTLEKVELAGDISGTVKGSVRIMEPLSRSRLNLSGEIGLPQDMALLLGSPASSPSERVRFSLRGTMDRPRFRLLSR